MLRAWVTEWMFSRVDLQVSGSLNTFILQYFGYYANSNCSGKEKVNEKRNKFIGEIRGKVQEVRKEARQVCCGDQHRIIAEF